MLQVLVGRNNKQNDELTTRVAKAGDVWMHARGCPGAHVLLRASTCNRCVTSQAVPWLTAHRLAQSHLQLTEQLTKHLLQSAASSSIECCSMGSVTTADTDMPCLQRNSRWGSTVCCGSSSMVLKKEGGGQVSSHHGVPLRFEEAQRGSPWPGPGDQGKIDFGQA